RSPKVLLELGRWIRAARGASEDLYGADHPRRARSVRRRRRNSPFLRLLQEGGDRLDWSARGGLAGQDAGGAPGEQKQPHGVSGG
ncbi:MAG: hypothetical protein WB823_18130, partial [Steroidobacteraceae bacterium]